MSGQNLGRVETRLTRQLGAWTVVITVAGELARVCARACSTGRRGC